MTDRISILMMIQGLALGEPLGGAERFGMELARALDKDKFKPIICALWRYNLPSEQYWMNFLAETGIEVFFATNIPRKLEPAGYLKGIKFIATHLRNKPIDVIHSHFQLGNIAAMLLKRSLNTKILIRTALAGKEWGDGLAAFLCRQIFTKWIFPFAFDAEVGVSQALVTGLNRRPGTRITGKQALLFHNAIPLDRFTSRAKYPNKRLDLGLSPNHLVVGNVGRLREEKGHSILLDSAVIVKAQKPNVKFVIIGSGGLWDSLHQKAERLELSETVIFAGPRQDVESLYGIMDLFVLPSLWEGLPTVILESMASGVAVVATDIPGTRELIQAGQTGWLAKPRDPVSLAACILEALNNPTKRATFAQIALQDVVPRFSMEYIAKQYEQMYNQLRFNTKN